ncbi:hypothetical protein D3C76_1457760 [compost metagenome]
MAQLINALGSHPESKRRAATLLNALFGIRNFALYFRKLLLQGFIAANVQHRVPGFLGKPGDRLPGRFQGAEVSLDLLGSTADLLGVKACGHLRRPHGVALLLQRNDVGVLRGGQNVQLSVELLDCLDRAFRDVVERLHDLVDVSTGLLRPGQRGLGDLRVH